MLEYFCYEHPMIVLIGAIILATAFVVAAVALPCRYAAEHQCNKRAAMLQTEYQYDFWTGCWIKDNDGTYIEYSTVRNVGGK